MNVPRGTSRYNDPPRSMEFAAACFIGAVFVVGLVCGLVLRPYLLAVIA